MPASAVYRRRGSGGEVSINVTPMIDVVFQLIIFFILASQFASKEIAKLSLPTPLKPKALKQEELKEMKVIINVLSKEDPRHRKKDEPFLPGDLAWYEIMGEKIPEAGAEERIRQYVESKLKSAKELGRDKDFYVEVRADYRVNYTYVASALAAAGQAGVKNVQFTVKEGRLLEERDR
jgi:biopolymer transport protein ExbD